MNINNFDKTIDNGMFLSKVDNIYIMLYTSIMEQDLSRVKHKVSDKVINKYQKVIDEFKNRNERQMYGQLNVKTSEITNVYNDEEGNIIVEVKLVSRYLDYVIDISTGEKLRGDNVDRVEVMNKLKLIKSKDTKELSESRHCSSCGKPLDLNSTGKCLYCGTIFKLSDYDYILDEINTSND